MAHKPSDSYLSLKGKAGSTDITVRWDIALRDLDYVLQLDRNGDGQLTWGECALVQTTSADWRPAGCRCRPPIRPVLWTRWGL